MTGDSFGVDAGADADFDVDTDGADFLAWQREFTGSGPLAASVIIPEPAGIILFGLGLLTLISLDHKRKIR